MRRPPPPPNRAECEAPGSNNASIDSFVVGDLPATGVAQLEFLQMGLVLVLLGIGMIGPAGYLSRDDEESAAY